MSEKLAFFPTPYPGEWWYSVLSRWYVRSPYLAQTDALHELYGCTEMKHGLLVPGPSCIAVAKKLPPQLFNLQNIFLEHTLLPYYMRFAFQEKKQIVLNNYIKGAGVRLTRMDDCSLDERYGPKYCPVCYRHDIEQYGEPYWRRTHQVPLMPLCPEHHCRLEQLAVNWSRQLKYFFPLSTVKCAADKMNFEEWEVTLSNNLAAYVSLPYWDGPSPAYNNLVWPLVSQGYGAPRFLKKGALDTQKLYDAIKAFFGQKVVDKYFNEADHTLFYRTVNWRFKSPERYALLQTFVGISPEDIFGADLMANSGIEEQLTVLRESGEYLTTDDITNQLNITVSQLEMIAERYKIAPFWKQKYGKGEKLRIYQLNLMMTMEEKELVRKVARGRPPSVFARELLMKAVNGMER